MATKEFREFFLRIVIVATGSKADQEVNFPVTALVKGISRNNRFLASNYPTEAVIRKLFESIAFKLNPEDTASSTIQGLVKKATDAIAIARTLNPNSDFTISVVPHQLPDLVVATDGSDASGTAILDNGIKVTPLTRTLSGGRTKRNFKVEVLFQGSIIKDGSTKALKLDGDITSPGNLQYYGSDSSGTKGWFTNTVKIVYLQVDFLAASTISVVTLGAGGNAFSFALKATSYYQFEAVLFITTTSNTNGARFGIDYSGTITEILSQNLVQTDATGFAIITNDRIVAIGGSGQSVADNFVTGVATIKGTIKTNTAGNLTLGFAQKVSGSSGSTVNKGSYFKLTQIL